MKRDDTSPASAGEETPLIQRAIQGDADAFARLYDRYIDSIYRFIFFRVGEDRTAEDLTSQVFLRAWEKLGKYELRGLPFGAWLFRIARNLIVDHYRAQRTQRGTLPLETHYVLEIESAYNVTEEIEAKIEVERLLALLDQLTEEQRQALTLKFIEGLSTEEIAQVMSKRAGAIRAVQMRGLQALAMLIEKQQHE